MTQNKTKKIWRQPWGYSEGIIIALGLLITGLALDFFTGIAIPKPAFPYNISLATFLISVLVLVYLNRKKSPLIRWLSSVPAAISSLGLFTFISVLMGLIPQKQAAGPGIFNLLDSWAYLLAYVWLLIVLGLSALKRVKPLKSRNIAYLLNHWGLWIALAAAGLGSGDVQKLNMYLQEGKTTWYAYDENRNRVELPFAFKLNDFVLENYPSKIALISKQKNEIISRNNKPLIADLPFDDSLKMGGFKIRTKKYVTNAVPIKGKQYQPSNDTGSVQAAYFEIDNTIDGWASPGNFMYGTTVISLNDSVALGMLKPEAKRYASEVRLFTKDGQKKVQTIEVNKPLKTEGWKVYQTDYDQRFGRWSRLSVLELVRDPWLPVVYIGLFMMIFGSLWLIFQGKTKKS